jgi:hypothetical protein
MSFARDEALKRRSEAIRPSRVASRRPVGRNRARGGSGPTLTEVAESLGLQARAVLEVRPSRPHPAQIRPRGRASRRGTRGDRNPHGNGSRPGLSVHPRGGVSYRPWDLADLVSTHSSVRSGCSRLFVRSQRPKSPTGPCWTSRLSTRSRGDDGGEYLQSLLGWEDC